jgi:uncharacterized protein (DUF58 family)
MIPAEILKKVRRIQIRTSALANELFAGQYHAVFKGRGIEFEEVREYQPGDDVRLLDWNVTARAGRPFIKSFREERELTVFLLVDISPSQEFGTREQLKSELVAELGATLAFSAIQNNDKVGLMLFTDRVEKLVPPRKGPRHVLRVVRELLYHEPVGRQTRVDVALEQLSLALNRRAVVFLISDFQTPEFSRELRIVKHRHDLIPILVHDQREAELPPVGFVELYDPERDEQIVVNTRSRGFRRRYAELSTQRREALLTQFRRERIDTIDVETGESFIDPLRNFFKKRGRRR